MNKNKQYEDFKDIDIKTYNWSVNVVRSVKRMLKVNMKLHADESALAGDIILCNHFSRFETFIPQFLIYEKTGEYTCAIASGEFFKHDTVLANYLKKVGVIPHDHQKLFPNLARQIFLGRKVIIFPEGGMVKDHRVMDNQGNYSIYSRISGERRKQHTGAAVLAQGIEVFKTTIRNAYGRKDFEQLLQWKQELKLDTLDQLLATALKPTLIVPSNITFYPIRSTENLLQKGVELFADGLSKRQTEELLVEGNILLKDTDMDLRMGNPVDPYDVWHWWNRYLLGMVTSELNSLDEVFSLYTSPNNQKQKLLGYYFKKNASATRNQYMREIYANVTINLSHLASTLIVYCLNQQLNKISKHCFYSTLYTAIKRLQTIKDIKLHRSLLYPEEYHGLIEGKSQRFEQFIYVAEELNLIISDEHHYEFKSVICDDYDFDLIRMENPIAVYCNEVQPIKQVRDSVVKAFHQYKKIKDLQLAEWEFDDELRSLAWDQKRYSKAHYQDINKLQTQEADPRPFLLFPNKRNGTGILLVHGLLASPAELREFAEWLVELGYTVMGIRIKGHGTSPCDLRRQTYEDWFSSVKRGLKILSFYSERNVVIGFSTGAALALKLAADEPEQVDAVVAVAVPVKFVSKSFLFIPLLHGTNKLVKWVSTMEGVKPYIENDPEHGTINYRSVPVKSLYELRRLIENIEEEMVKINQPALVVYGDKDPIVHLDSNKVIMNTLSSNHKKLVVVESEKHGILMENISDTWQIIQSFLSQHLTSNG